MSKYQQHETKTMWKQYLERNLQAMLKVLLETVKL